MNVVNYIILIARKYKNANKSVILKSQDMFSIERERERSDQS